jgi:hypothetical protein
MFHSGSRPAVVVPVYVTVAQARFNTLLKLADYVPSTQEAMRKAGFPDFTSRKTVALHLFH